MVKFDNGAIATAEASFSAVYGYDVRAEVFGSAGMVTAGDAALTGMTHYTTAVVLRQPLRNDIELMRDAFAGEFASMGPRLAGALYFGFLRLDGVHGLGRRPYWLHGGALASGARWPWHRGLWTRRLVDISRKRLRRARGEGYEGYTARVRYRLVPFVW